MGPGMTRLLLRLDTNRLQEQGLRLGHGAQPRQQPRSRTQQPPGPPGEQRLSASTVSSCRQPPVLGRGWWENAGNAGGPGQSLESRRVTRGCEVTWGHGCQGCRHREMAGRWQRPEGWEGTVGLGGAAADSLPVETGICSQAGRCHLDTAQNPSQSTAGQPLGVGVCAGAHSGGKERAAHGLLSRPGSSRRCAEVPPPPAGAQPGWPGARSPGTQRAPSPGSPEDGGSRAPGGCTSIHILPIFMGAVWGQVLPQPGQQNGHSGAGAGGCPRQTWVACMAGGTQHFPPAPGTHNAGLVVSPMCQTCCSHAATLGRLCLACRGERVAQCGQGQLDVFGGWSQGPCTSCPHTAPCPVYPAVCCSLRKPGSALGARAQESCSGAVPEEGRRQEQCQERLKSQGLCTSQQTPTKAVGAWALAPTPWTTCISSVLSAGLPFPRCCSSSRIGSRCRSCQQPDATHTWPVLAVLGRETSGRC